MDLAKQTTRYNSGVSLLYRTATNNCVCETTSESNRNLAAKHKQQGTCSLILALKIYDFLARMEMKAAQKRQLASPCMLVHT